ncbi:MAG: FRG domain-containing protein [Deltaproteobacteria bacterium]|nr:FRG domain-containing protein [Deltaproteobacteria bacterium]
MFYRIIVDSWNDVLLLCDQITHKSSNWAFRGQSDEGWKLSTKFEREAEKYQCDSYWFKNREKIILQDFQRNAHHYVQNLPDSENYIEWLSLLQHYGGPTRLLDFTYSYYLAAFFAVETSDINSAIWAVNINQLIEQLSKIPDYNSIKKEGMFEVILERNNHYAETVIKNRKNVDIVFIVEPFQQHERISIQQGLFLFPGNIEKPFEHNLCSVFEFDFKDLSSKNALDMKFSEIGNLNFSDISIIKIVIPASLHSKALAELYNMNVTAATLFPGLDGFARSLSFRFRQLDHLLNRKG